MTYPIKIRKNTNGTFKDGIQVMSAQDLDWVVNAVLYRFSSTETSPADILFSSEYLGSGNRDIGTSIGDFIDRYDARSVDSFHTYILKQNQQTVQESGIIYPAKWHLNSIRPQTSSDLDDTIIQRCLDKIANSSNTPATGTYYISINTPATILGGTWSQIQRIPDFSNRYPDIISNDYKLWRCVTNNPGSQPYSIPIRIDESNGNIHEMNDSQINKFVDRLRNRIRSSGIGTYRLQANSPTTGSWIQRGSVISWTLVNNRPQNQITESLWLRIS